MIPYTDTECRLKLEEISRGDVVILPTSYAHAELMLRVSSAYIRECHQQTLDVLKANYENN